MPLAWLYQPHMYLCRLGPRMTPRTEPLGTIPDPFRPLIQKALMETEGTVLAMGTHPGWSERRREAEMWCRDVPMLRLPGAEKSALLRPLHPYMHLTVHEWTSV